MKGRPLLCEAASPEAVEKILDCQVDADRIKSFDYLGDLSSPRIANPGEAQKLLDELRSSFDTQRLEQLFGQTRQELFGQLPSPLV